MSRYFSEESLYLRGQYLRPVQDVLQLQLPKPAQSVLDQLQSLLTLTPEPRKQGLHSTGQIQLIDGAAEETSQGESETRLSCLPI